MAKWQYESLAQAAERTGISVKALRRRIIDGELVAFRSGRLIRVEPKAVDPPCSGRFRRRTTTASQLTEWAQDALDCQATVQLQIERRRRDDGCDGTEMERSAR